MKRAILSLIVVACLAGIVWFGVDDVTINQIGNHGITSPLDTPPIVAATTSTQQQKKPGFVFFDVNDGADGISARVYLPLVLGDKWAIENPWRDADKSIIPQLGVFVKAVFQNAEQKTFYGSVLVIRDLKGHDCGELFLKLGQADGYTLSGASDTLLERMVDGHMYIFQFYDKVHDAVMSSKIMCSDKTAIQLIVVSPNDKNYTESVNEMLKAVDLNMVGTERENYK